MIVFAALAVGRWIGVRTGRSTREFVQTARRHPTVHIEAGDHIGTAAGPLRGDLRQVIEAVNSSP